MKCLKAAARVACACAMLVTGSTSNALDESPITRPGLDLFAKIRAINAHAFATDFQCVNDCTRMGYMHALCMQKCSHFTPGQASPPTPA